MFVLEVRIALNLKGLRAVVSGASYGLGRAAGIRFAELGAKVVLVSRNLEALSKTQ